MANLIEVAKTYEIRPGEGKLIEVEGYEIALFNCDGSYYAIDNTCTHQGGPLCEGDLEGDKVICPWHGAEFDVKSGNVLAPPAEASVKSYRVEVDGDSIKIEI
jgi:3-phenylpropionate/trans-cinnamate dioxygenase ferredoxin component